MDSGPFPKIDDGLLYRVSKFFFLERGRRIRGYPTGRVKRPNRRSVGVKREQIVLKKWIWD